MKLKYYNIPYKNKNYIQADLSSFPLHKIFNCNINSI